jgi:hypothetical protein
MIISTNTRQASFIQDEPTASFSASSVVRQRVARPPGRAAMRPARATVEILILGGGMMPRALLGGAFTPSDGDELLIEVLTSGLEMRGERTVVSRLHSSLVCGLPDEFAQFTIDGLAEGGLPAGRIVVDRAGFDPVE